MKAKWVLSVFILVLLSVTICCAENSPSMRLSKTDVRIAVGKTETLKVEFEGITNKNKVKLNWEVDNSSIATVKNGMVKGVSAGEAVVKCIAHLEDDTEISASVPVKVFMPVRSVKLNTTRTITLSVGEKLKVDYSVLPEDATDPTLVWTVSDETVGSVDEAGVISALAPGKTTIIGKPADGSKLTVQMTLYVPVMNAGTYDIDIDTLDGADFEIDYHGEWDKNIKIQQKGAAVAYSIVRTNESKIVFHLDPVRTGTDSITITDSSDPNSKIKLNIRVLNSAIAPSFGVLIDSAELKNNRSRVNYQFSITNGFQAELVEITYLVDYYDTYEKQKYIRYSSTNELTDYSFTKLVNVKPEGKLVIKNSTDVFDAGNPLGEIRIAIVAYRLADGTKVKIPDSQLYWYSTKTGYGERPVIESIYHMPDELTIEKSDEFLLGIWSVDLYSYISKKYASSKYSGDYLTKIGQGSIAERSGLIVGDVIYGADELWWKDEPYFFEIVKARMFDGATVVLHVMRYGDTVDIPVSRTPAAEDEH